MSTDYNYWHWRAMREIALRRDKCCIYCQKELDITTATLDHIIPVARGGGSNITNLGACCRECNTLKGDKLPLDFIHAMTSHKAGVMVN